MVLCAPRCSSPPPSMAIAQGEGMMGGVVKGEMKEDLELGCSGDEGME